jgi:hypothetical protein
MSLIGAFSVSMTATPWSRDNTFANQRGSEMSLIEEGGATDRPMKKQ